MSRVKVYYNSACPVCNAGIEGQKRRMQGCGVDVDWIDIHRNAEAVREIGADREFVRERLHVVDEKGQLQIGADAFRALWRHTPGQKALARLLRLPGAPHAARWLYNAFARALYLRNRAARRW